MVGRDTVGHNAAVHHGKVRGVDGIHRDVVNAEVGGSAGGAVRGAAVVGAAVRGREDAQEAGKAGEDGRVGQRVPVARHEHRLRASLHGLFDQRHGVGAFLRGGHAQVRAAHETVVKLREEQHARLRAGQGDLLHGQRLFAREQHHAVSAALEVDRLREGGEHPGEPTELLRLVDPLRALRLAVEFLEGGEARTGAVHHGRDAGKVQLPVHALAVAHVVAHDLESAQCGGNCPCVLLAEIDGHAAPVREGGALHEAVGREPLEGRHAREHRLARHFARACVRGRHVLLKTVPGGDVHGVDGRDAVEAAEEVLQRRKLRIHEGGVRPIVVVHGAVVVHQLPERDAVLRVVHERARAPGNLVAVERLVLVAPAKLLAKLMRKRRKPLGVVVGIEQVLVPHLHADHEGKVVRQIAVFRAQRLQRLGARARVGFREARRRSAARLHVHEARSVAHGSHLGRDEPAAHLGRHRVAQRLHRVHLPFAVRY